MKRPFAFLMLASVLCFACPSAHAADFPNRAVQLIVGYVPGGGADFVARTVAASLSSKWNQQVVVMNESGASGMRAADHVVHAQPDGYTLLLGYTPEVSIDKLIYAKMPYDPIRDLQPVAIVANSPLILVAGPKLKVDSFAELTSPTNKTTELTFGSPGTGSQQYLAGEMLKLKTGLKLTHIPYRGGAAVVTDLLGGQIDLFFAAPPVLLPLIKAGRLRPLLVTSDNRLPQLPNVPTGEELGLKGFEVSNWFGVFAPKGVAPALIAKLASDIDASLSSPELESKYTVAGMFVRHKSGAEFSKFIGMEMDKYRAIIEAAGIRPL